MFVLCWCVWRGGPRSIEDDVRILKYISGPLLSKRTTALTKAQRLGGDCLHRKLVPFVTVS